MDFSNEAHTNAGKLLDNKGNKFYEKVENNICTSHLNKQNQHHAVVRQDLDWWDVVNNVGLKAHFIASQLAVPIMLRSTTVRCSPSLQTEGLASKLKCASTPHIGNGRQVERPGLIVHVSSAGGLRYIFDVACTHARTHAKRRKHARARERERRGGGGGGGQGGGGCRGEPGSGI